MTKLQWVIIGVFVLWLVGISVAMQRSTPIEKAVAEQVEQPVTVLQPPVKTEDFSHLQDIIDQGGDEAFYVSEGKFDHFEFQQLEQTYERRIHDLVNFKKYVAEAEEVDRKRLRQQAKIISDACWEVASEYNMRARYLGDAELEAKEYKDKLNTNLCDFRED